MAMNKTVLGKALADLVISPSAPPDKQAQITAQWTDIAGAIIDHIKQNAEVTVTAGIATQVNIATGTGATTAPGSGTIQ